MPTPDIHPPSPAELARLFAAAGEADPDLADFILLVAATGARRSELVALRWSDIDLEAGRFTISRGVVAGPDGLVVKDTKTHAGPPGVATAAAWPRCRRTGNEPTSALRSAGSSSC